MAAIVSEESGVGRSLGGVPGGRRGQPGEALAEWRSSEQVENGSPSTSPPYWDTDDDDEGAKPSELYGKHTWKIEKFSQINKRELRSAVFEVGCYKWYILIYPQGCDVCNHLSLFLCVANHDKLLPGWSHFAQFTIAVVNKDPKKSKYSDTLHRFWKKEHDWGWKKFMELSKVLDGFIDADTLIIKAQVQVIREKADRPFRCLDLQYRRELVRVYLSNVEQICRKFVEEKRTKLMELIEDKARWSSFCAFWLGMDQNVKRRMSREKTDVILKVVVKQFFIEKEVTSTLVMDSLYSGLKALEGQSKCNKGRVKLLEAEEMPAPIVHVEKDMFLLVDDVLLLLERAAMEPLPPKDDKGPQNRTKDGGSGEDCNKDSIERDERRLTEMGRRTVETFVLAHIFSQKIEVAHQEAVALKRQEELIREEEEGLAESEQKAKRRGTEKEKKSKKKQAKQKRNNRKGKDKGRDEKAYATVPTQQVLEIANDEIKDLMIDQARPVLEKPESQEDVSDVSDSVDFVAENSQADSEERDYSPVNWDTDTSEVHPPTEASSSGISGLSCVQHGTMEKKSSSVMDDSSSTCSTDSVPSVVMSGSCKGNSFSNHKAQKFPSRGKVHRAKATNDSTSLANEADDQPSVPTTDAGVPNDVSGSCKDEEAVSLQRKLCIRDQDDVEKPSKEKVAVPPSPRSPHRNLPSNIKLKSEPKCSSIVDPSPARKPSSSSPQHTDKLAPSTLSQVSTPAKPDSQKAATSKPIVDKSTALQVPAMARPSSAPLIPGSRPPAPVVSIVQTAPLLARSVSATGRLGPDPSTPSHSSHNYAPQSYRNAMMGNPGTSTSPGLSHPRTPGSLAKPQSSAPAPVFLRQPSDRVDAHTVKTSFSFGMLNRDMVQNGHSWRDASGNPSLVNDAQNFDLYKVVDADPQEQLSSELSSAGTSGRQSQGMLADDFPHLDIINDLLDDEHGMGRAATVFQGHTDGARFLNRQYSFPGDMTGISGDESPTSSCRFERTLSYQADGFQRAYGSLGSHFNSFLDYVPQANPLPYANGQIDGFMPNQWQVSASDLSLLGMGSTDADVYPYHMPEYQNLACSVNGYTVFRPSNGN